MVKIHLFNAKTTKNDLIQYNGEFILDNICKKAIITEELNGEYGFEGIFAISNVIPSKGYELLTEDSLLKVNDEYGEEYFRIASIDKSKYEIEVYARHITISDILTMWCEDVRPENQNGNGAINWIFENAIGNNPFQVSSNISNTNTAYYNNKTVYEALFTTDNAFLNRWGGEVYRRGFNIAINDRVGADRGVSIRSRKNLLGFEANTNLNELTTRIYPKGFDGITIEEKYIDSPLINNYARIYSRELKFDDIRVNDDYYQEGYATLQQAQEELKRRCREQFENKKIDVINASYRVNFVELGKTEEYKNYSILEKTWIGDTINVVEENLNIDINVRVVKRQYNVMTQERINTELSNKDTKIKLPTISDIIVEIEKIPDAENILQQAKENATALINAGIKNSYVVVRKNEILIMDTEDINTAKKVWRWNNGGLGYSSTGYYGQYGTAITNDGAIVADFITTGILNAGIVKTGILSSFDNSSWINLDDGSLNFKENLKVDNKGNVDIKGKISNESQDGSFGTYMDKGGISFKTTNENVGGIRASRFDSNEFINGVSIVGFDQGDYLDLGYADGGEIDQLRNFVPMIRMCRNENALTGNFVGIQLKHNIRVDSGRILSFAAASGYDHEMFSISGGYLGIFGDNGVKLGYRDGNNRNSLIEATENLDSENCKIRLAHTLNMQGFSIKNVNQFYYTGGDMIGSVKNNVPRVSNLNTFFESGWYACGSDCINTPEPWGIVLHFKCFGTDFAQQFHSTTNKLYIRWYVNKQWSAWKVW